MIWLPELRPNPALRPEIRPESQAVAEVVVGPHVLTVTMPLAQIAEGDLELIVTPTSLKLRSKADPKAPTLLVPLPVNVQPDRFLLSHHNGVLDLTIERASH